MVMSCACGEMKPLGPRQTPLLVLAPQGLLNLVVEHSGQDLHHKDPATDGVVEIN